MNLKQARSYMAAGALAGLSAVLIVMLCVTLLIYIGGIWQYAFNSSIPVINQVAGGALMQDLSRIPSFLWGWRWIILALAIGGLLLALWERFVQRYPPMWHNGLVAGSVFIVISTLVIARTLMSADETVFNGGDASETLAALGQRGVLTWGQILFSTALATIIAGIIWLSWKWWYARWSRWLRLDPVLTVQDASTLPAEEWFARRQARAHVQRTILLALLGAAVALAGLVYGYDQVRASVRSGILWVEPATPASAVQLPVQSSTERLFVENSFGTGTVSVALSTAGNNTPSSGATDLTFQDGQASFERTEISIAGLPAGTYQLTAQLRSGPGGRISYALIQQRGFVTTLLATLIGLAMGAILALVVLLVHMRGHQQSAA